MIDDGSGIASAPAYAGAVGPILDDFDFSGRVAVITGGGTGIGAATARILAQLGADVVIAGRREGVLQEMAALIESEGRRCVPVPADVREPEGATHLIERTVAEFGRIDILVNNAGKACQGSLAAMAVSDWRGEFALNTDAAFLCSRAALPHFTAQRSGAIVNVGSVAGTHGTMGAGGYSAAKAALQMFTRVAAAEWGPRGIRINCVAAGMTATEFGKNSWAELGFDGYKAAEAFPIGRPGEPEEVAKAVVFLASKAASYITGETLSVSGGPLISGMVGIDD